MMVDGGVVDCDGRVVGELLAEGWLVTAPIVPEPRLDALAAELRSWLKASSERGGVRNLLGLPSVRELVRSPSVRDLAAGVLGDGCVAVRATLFDKTPAANWKVPWHQDLTIAVAERHALAGHGPWTRKGGVPHVQPPAAVLEQMLAVRVHLDACGPDNGPLRVLPGSHRAGRLSAAEIDAWRESQPSVVCAVRRDGIVAMRPLLLHASSAAAIAASRRVLHVEFASATALPPPLRWPDAV
jgi:hypothetical protein